MTRRALIGILVGTLGLAVVWRACASEWPEHEGRMRQTAHLQAFGLRRGAPGTVYLSATAHYTPHASDEVRTVPVPEFDSSTLTLVDAAKAVTKLKVSWSTSGYTRVAKFELPEVPDGDYQLHATYATSLGKGELDLPVPLYTPARIHVITDRPLYEPGNVIRFRAVVLRARDLVPLDGRPGRWVVTDPNGEVLLEEKAPAGDFGVVAGSFPLDKAAEVGSWKVAWVSNDARDEVPVTVQPFTLPRFRVEAAAARPFYAAGDKPVISGAVIYSSGAPVARARLDIAWDVAGAWPAPTEWQDKLLPKQAVTAADGRFELAMPQIPKDLQGKVTVTARISAVDPAGDRVEGAASVLLSQDGIDATTVTELGDGLVQGFNNRMYVRVTTPDGGVLANTKIKVKRAWQGNDPGVDAVLDEDGVASLQLDPGPPVNVVIPALPWRPAPRPPAVTRGDADELIGGEGASMADQIEMDRWLAALAPCAKWYAGDNGGTDAARVGLRVSAGGAVVAAGGGSTALERCVVGVLRPKRLPAGAERMYALTFDFTDPDLPSLGATIEAALGTPDGLEPAIQELAASARDCLPQTVEGSLPRALTWRATAGQKDVQLGDWVSDPQGGEAAAAMACVASRIGGGRVHLDEPAEEDALGLIRFAVALPERARQERPQATTMLGYEFLVSADVEGAPATKLRVTPGQIPSLRMRVTPVLAKAGETITAELIRGPDFTGELPKEIAIRCLKQQAKAKLDADHKAKLALEPDVEGWCELTGGSVRALVYIKPAVELAVTVAPEQPRYGPGQQAKLIIQTLLGGKGGKAAVGLFGVDDSLGQLVALPGADDMARVRPQVETTAPAFGVLDGQALSLGRIRGANAAAATVLRVGAIPRPPELDAVVSAAADSHFDAIEELTDRFYVVLAELYVQARAWEASAPAGEKMRPATMAALWKKALAACKHRGERVDDAYGRELRLRILPQDLLALTDPHVVITGTRLPEDVENWTAWVAKERP